MSSAPRITALIVAAGTGSRAGGDVPKQYQPLAGVPMLKRTVAAFLHHPDISEVQVVIAPGHRHYYDAAMVGLTLGDPIAGGAERQDSVRLGLEALAADAPDHVLIHDAARPCLSPALITRVIDGLATHKAVMPVLRMTDTLREQTPDGWQERPRDSIVAVQTPQGFHFQAILNAHGKANGPQRTDDIAVLLAYDAAVSVLTVEGEPQNRKLTTQADRDYMAARIGSMSIPRIGTGYDVHKLIPGEGAIRIGGIDIPHTHRLEGHSDADVVLHAITDALLGTIADGDIGAHFSPTDARWKGADSATFLKEAAHRVTVQGGSIAHLDVTILCEAPKIAPHRDAIRARIAELLALPLAQVSVKATTTEGLGFTGRREGIAAQAAATVLFQLSEAA